MIAKIQQPVYTPIWQLRGCQMSAAPASGSWADVLGEGRLPRFVLICLAVWLNAADSLVTATIMPSVGRALGGYAFFGWATAGYLMGSVLAGASSGVFALRFGLRSATAAAALTYVAGCMLSALAPDMTVFLIGRMLQGIGGGWLAGLSQVAIGLLFPNLRIPMKSPGQSAMMSPRITR
jgi:MFS family permease